MAKTPFTTMQREALDADREQYDEPFRSPTEALTEALKIVQLLLGISGRDSVVNGQLRPLVRLAALAQRAAEDLELLPDFPADPEHGAPPLTMRLHADDGSFILFEQRPGGDVRGSVYGPSANTIIRLIHHSLLPKVATKPDGISLAEDAG